MGFFLRTILIQFAERALQLTLIQAPTGVEKEARAACAKAAPDASVFKLLGEYDLAYLRVVDWPESGHVDHLPKLQKKSMLLALFATKAMTNPESAAQKIITDSQVLGLVFVKLVAEAPRSAIHAIADELTAETGFGISTLPTITGETYELAVLVGTMTVEPIFHAVDRWRRRYSHVIADTETRIGVSYPKVIDRLDDSAVNLGSASASISCFIRPGDEQLVLDSLENKYKTYRTSGKADVLATTSGPRPVKEIISEVLRLRVASQAANALHCTHTQLFVPIERGAVNTSEQISTPRTTEQTIAALAETCLDLISKPELSCALPAHLSEKTTITLSKIRDTSSDPVMAGQASMFSWCLRHKLPDLFRQIEKYREGGAMANQAKLDGARKNLSMTIAAVAAEFSGLAAANSAFGWASRSLDNDYGNVCAASTSMNLLLRSMYETLGRTEYKLPTWHGFCSLKPLVGFQVEKSVFQAPAELVLPFHAGGQSWTTLSHEFSHDVLTRCETRIGNTWFEEILARVASGEGTDKPLDIPAIWEWFAHWFDYVHFYQRHRDFFTSAIWDSWLENPTVLESPREYLARSLAIWVVDDRSALKKHLTLQNRIQLIEERYGELCGFLRGRYSARSAPLVAALSNSDIRKEAVGTITQYVAIFSFFEANFVRTKFASRHDWTRHEVCEAFESAKSGKSTPNLDFPFALLLKAQHETWSNDFRLTAKFQLALRETFLQIQIDLSSHNDLVFTYNGADSRLSKLVEAMVPILRGVLLNQRIHSQAVDSGNSPGSPVNFSDLADTYYYHTRDNRDRLRRRWVHLDLTDIDEVPLNERALLTHRCDAATNVPGMFAELFSKKNQPHWMESGVATEHELRYLRNLPETAFTNLQTKTRAREINLPIAIFSIHGLISPGRWQNTLHNQLKNAKHYIADYGWFVLAFFPCYRERKLREFGVKYRQFIKDCPKREHRQIVFAHSFGTWLAFEYLRKHPESAPDTLEVA